MRVYFLFGKILYLLWPYFKNIGQIWAVASSQIMTNNRAIWSHCSHENARTKTGVRKIFNSIGKKAFQFFFEQQRDKKKLCHNLKILLTTPSPHKNNYNLKLSLPSMSEETDCIFTLDIIRSDTWSSYSVLHDLSRVYLERIILFSRSSPNQACISMRWNTFPIKNYDLSNPNQYNVKFLNLKS